MIKYCGVDYYPEQWGLEVLEDDFDKMQELGVNLIRIGDFAWDRFESEDGKYSFDLFDEVVKKAKQRNIKVLMCVPTATMPSWLYAKYPEIMNENEEGYRQPFGARRGYCYNSDIYVKKATDLAKAIAHHYKDEDNIVAYQVDNEAGHEGSDVCWCENCHKKFIEYLKEKYKDINELNQRWGTSFWTNTYFRFEDIPLPKKAFTPHNPSLRLEWYRFRSLSIERYIKTLVDAVKSEDNSKPVTHDFEGGIINKAFDPFKVSKHIDFVSYNNYPVWGGQKQPMSDSEIAFSVEFAHGFKRQNIWVTEAIMGAQGHNDIGFAPRPNQAKKWSLDSLDHGVESLIFFRFRGFNKGAEQFCYGILDTDNEKRRKYYETKDFFKEAKEKPLNTKKAQACIIYDYDSKCSMEIQRQSSTFSYEKECNKLFEQMYTRNIQCDVISSDSDFSNYKLVLIPYMIIMSDEFKRRLKDYVRSGGTVVLTPRTAYKDDDNNFVFGKRLPVDLQDLTGVVIEESESLLDGQSSTCTYENKQYQGYVFEECFNLKGATSLVSWYNNPFGEYSAATVNNYGKGKCYYLGSSFEKELLNKLFDLIELKN